LLALPNRRGIQGATTREIARRAGVHGVTLFRDFKSKEQVLRAILKRGLTGKATVMDENSSRKENLRESMEKYGRPYYSHLEKKRLRGRVADGSPIAKLDTSTDRRCDLPGARTPREPRLAKAARC
jgi:AcrR family transcriptional regulator